MGRSSARNAGRGLGAEGCEWCGDYSQGRAAKEARDYTRVFCDLFDAGGYRMQCIEGVWMVVEVREMVEHSKVSFIRWSMESQRKLVGWYNK